MAMLPMLPMPMAMPDTDTTRGLPMLSLTTDMDMLPMPPTGMAMLPMLPMPMAMPDTDTTRGLLMLKLTTDMDMLPMLPMAMDMLPAATDMDTIIKLLKLLKS